MTTISSHVLDSVFGDHASGIRVACFRILDENSREKIFDVIANKEGRIVEKIENSVVGAEYELNFYSTAYFAVQPNMPEVRQIMDTVVVRFTPSELDERIHIPVVLSPYSYTIWWSG